MSTTEFPVPVSSALPVGLSAETLKQPVGCMIGEFQVLKQLGAGADGVSLLGVSASEEEAEIRVLRAAKKNKNRWVDLSARLKLVQLLEHQTNLKILAVSTEGDAPFVCLESGDWRPFSAALTSAPPNHALTIALELAGCMAAAHRLRLVHGALAPSAIRLDGAWRPKVDFTGVQTGGVFDNASSADAAATPSTARDVRSLARLIQSLLVRAQEESGADYSRRKLAALKQRLRLAVEASNRAPTAKDLAEAIADLIDSPEPVESDSALNTDSTVDLPITVQPALPTGNADDTGVFEIAPAHAPFATGRSLTPGEALGRYVLQHQLGEGGMGAVFKAIDQSNDQIVAIKVLRSEMARDKKAVRRFHKEARLLAAVNNPYVTRLIEVNEDAGMHYMVMECVEGTELKEVLTAEGPLSELRALQIAADVARGLIAAHREGIVHRDIKPANILLEHEQNGQRRVKVTDFGIARFIDQSQSLAVTQTGALLGTPLYMSPEQCKARKEITPQSDVYSLGVMLYEMLAGRPPFVANDPMKLATMHCFDAPKSLASFNSSVSEEVQRIVEKTLAKRTIDRYADAAHLLTDLERLLRGEASPIDVHPLLPPHKATDLVQAEFQWELDSTPEQLWPYVSNTERLNKAIGLPPVEYTTELNDQNQVIKFGTFRIGGMSVRWQEHPFEWVEGRRMGVLREFAKGPFRWLASEVEFQSMPSGKTRLTHQIRVQPRNGVGRLLAKMEVEWKSKRSLNRVYRRIDETIQQAENTTDRSDAFEPAPKLTRIQRARLEQRIDSLPARGVPIDLAAELREFIATAPQQEAAKIHPADLAQQWSREPQEVIDACLHATAAGLLTLYWDILCPTCRVAADAKLTLKEVKSHAHCSACNIDFESDMADAVELVFRVDEDLRDTRVGKYCVGGPAHFPHIAAQVQLNPLESLDLELSLNSGRYALRGPCLPQSIEFDVSSRSTVTRWEPSLDADGEPSERIVLSPGSQVICFTNQLDRTQLIKVERTTARQGAISAAAASQMHLFRSLFPDNVLESGQLITAKQITLLVTQLEDSHHLYAEHGDAAAYAVIHRLLEGLTEQIQLHHGTVIKQVGEGVVATFPNIVDAVRAAAALQQNVAVGETQSRVRLNVGVHRGSVLVTNQNGRLDYFGATVNRATALPALARGQVVLTEEVFGDPAVAELLQQGSYPHHLQEMTAPGNEKLLVQILQPV